MNKLFKFIIEGLFNIIFPKICVCCNKKIYSDFNVCFSCYSSLPFLYDDSSSVNVVSARFAEKFYLSLGCSLFVFKQSSILQKIVHSIKYSGNAKLAFELGKIIGNKVKLLSCSADFIVPIPLHYKKKALRGYNQSELIANGISYVTGIEVCTDLVYRKKNTLTQTKKDVKQRYENVENVFDVKEKDRFRLVGKKIMIVDDVLTTGATISSFAERLLELKVSHIDVAVLAVVI